MMHSFENFALSVLARYVGRTLISAEHSSIDLDNETKKSGEEKEVEEEAKEAKDELKNVLTEAEEKDLCAWMAKILGSKKVRQVRT